jgi:hypothetical protein
MTSVILIFWPFSIDKECFAMPSFTVICLYPDYVTNDFGADLYIGTVEADDAFQAADFIRLQAAEENRSVAADDFRPIVAFSGEFEICLRSTDF